MAVKPTPGGSDGTYGTELNAFLDVSIASDGKIKDGAVFSTSAAPSVDAGVANKKYVDDSILTDNFVAKAWGNITGTTINAGANISGVTNPATGTFVVSWDTNFSSGSYAVLITPLHATAHFLWIVTTKGAGASATIKFENTSFAAANPTSFDVVAFGAQ